MQRELKSSNWATHDILEDIDTISRRYGLLAHHPLAHAEEKLDDQI